MKSHLDNIEGSVSKEFDVYSNKELKNVEVELDGRLKVRCPVNKEEDYLWFTIDFKSNGDGDFIEYISFHSWLQSLEDEELGLEKSCQTIYDTITKLCKPTLLRVVIQTGYTTYNQKATRKNWKTDLNRG